MSGPDVGVTTTRLEAIEIALEDVQAHDQPATLIICRMKDAPGFLCGSARPGGGCEFCLCHEVGRGDTAEEIERIVAANV